MAKPDTPMRVLIIGGGAAGLLMAQALRKQNIPCSVFEQDPSRIARSRDWNYGVYWAQSPLSECMSDELASQLVNAQVDDLKPSKDAFMPLLNSQNGEVLLKAPTPFHLRLHRRKFIELISTDVDIRYSKRLAKVESDGSIVKAYFEDGSVESGTLLIGAEGAHSKAREFLLGSEKAAMTPSPYMSNACMVKLPKDIAVKMRAVHHRHVVMYHPIGQFAWIGIHEAWDRLAPEEWTWMILQSWNSDDEENLPKGNDIIADMRVRADDWAEPFKSVVYSIPEGTKCWHSRLGYWLPTPWDNRNGTVTLIGDACHPMTYHRGQGLNNAILDVAELARQIKAHGLITPETQAKAIAAYEAEMQERGKAAVESSNQNSHMCHDWNQLLESPIFKMGLAQKAAEAEAEANA